MTMISHEKMENFVQSKKIVFNYHKTASIVGFITIVTIIFRLDEYIYLSFMAVSLGLMCLSSFKFNKIIFVMIFCIMFLYTGCIISYLQFSESKNAYPFTIHFSFMVFSLIFYVLYLSNNTLSRYHYLMNAYVAGAVIATIIGMLGYFNIYGREQFVTAGRINGPFDDINHYSSFIVTPTLFLMQRILIGEKKWTVFNIIVLIVIMAGQLLSGSRGSLLATVICLTIMYFMILTSITPQKKSQVIRTTTYIIIALFIIFIFLQFFESFRELFFGRFFEPNADDSGETGRFGRQLRHIPYILDYPLGFGPYRSTMIFRYAPHSAYINSFMSYGWLGGVSYILLLILTLYVGARVCLNRSPYQEISQVLYAGFVGVVIQGIQIDTDHWAFFYMLLASVWCLESSRLNWLADQKINP